MPLLDHFRPPLDEIRHWEGFHATWPVMITARLGQVLPAGYYAEPRVHAGSAVEIDVAAFDRQTGPAPGPGASGPGAKQP